MDGDDEHNMEAKCRCRMVPSGVAYPNAKNVRVNS